MPQMSVKQTRQRLMWRRQNEPWQPWQRAAVRPSQTYAPRGANSHSMVVILRYWVADQSNRPGAGMAINSADAGQFRA